MLVLDASYQNRDDVYLDIRHLGADLDRTQFADGSLDRGCGAIVRVEVPAQPVACGTQVVA